MVNEANAHGGKAAEGRELNRERGSMKRKRLLTSLLVGVMVLTMPVNALAEGNGQDISSTGAEEGTEGLVATEGGIETQERTEMPGLETAGDAVQADTEGTEEENQADGPAGPEAAPASEETQDAPEAQAAPAEGQTAAVQAEEGIEVQADENKYDPSTDPYGYKHILVDGVPYLDSPYLREIDIAGRRYTYLEFENGSTHKLDYTWTDVDAEWKSYVTMATGRPTCFSITPDGTVTCKYTDKELENIDSAHLYGTEASGHSGNRYTNIQIEVVGEYPGDSAPEQPAGSDSISYRTHVQTYGWQDWAKDGAMSGTEGQAKRLEGIEIKAGNGQGVRYRTHVQTYGWQDWVSDGAMSGTEGQAKRLEAIQIELTGEMAQKYDVYYRVHAQSYGWLGWAVNGGQAGTAGYGKRLEGIEIKLVAKGGAAPGSTEGAYVHPLIQYQTHVQTYGWQGWKNDGAMSGTEGQAKRLEGIKIQFLDPPYSGDVRYKTHVQTYGWQDWVSNGAMSGTSGQAKRLEGIQIELTGDMAAQYDIYYRVHAQTFGWMGWAKNGEQAGTAGYAKRLEGIEIKLVAKGGAAPGSTDNHFREK